MLKIEILIRTEETVFSEYTHVESGSLSLLPRPGILKAFARLFFPPSGANVVMYSSKPTRAAETYTFRKHTHDNVCAFHVCLCDVASLW